MKKNIVPLLGIAFVVAIITTILFYTLFIGKTKTDGEKTIVVATHDIAPGTQLKATDLKVIPWGAPSMPRGAYSKVSDLVGQKVFEGTSDGEPIFAAKLASNAGMTKTGIVIEPGMRAVSVHVTDSTGVMELLRPGNKVDAQVVATRNGNYPDSELRTVVTELTVILVNPLNETSTQTHILAPVVTLLATPAEADVLALGDSAGRVRLTLRNPLDDDRSQRTSVILTNLMKGTGLAAPPTTPVPVVPKAK